MTVVERPTAAARVLLGAWLLAMLGLGSALVLKHEAPLPEAVDDAPAGVARAITASRLPESRSWLAVHVLAASCGCSMRVMDALSSHAPERGVEERIALVVDDGESPPEIERARSLGYAVEVMTREGLVRRYGIQAVPSFAVVSPDGQLRYLGGYSTRRRGPVLEDRSILAQLLRGQSVPALPTFGCAVGARLAERVNPLGL